MSDTKLEELKLAFGYHFARLVVETDGSIGEDEHRFLDTLFWREKLVAAGLITAAGEVTLDFADRVREAITVLPVRASEAERLDVLTLILRATLSDGRFEWGEGTVVNKAAELLGLSNQAVDHHFETMGDLVGSLDLPEPEPGA